MTATDAKSASAVGVAVTELFFCDICQNEICDYVFFVDNQHVCEECLPEVIPHCNVEDYFDEEEYFDE